MIYLNDSSHDSHFPILHQGIVFACKEFKEVSVMAVFFCLFDLRGRYRKQPIIQDRSSVSMIPSNTLEAGPSIITVPSSKQVSVRIPPLSITLTGVSYLQ